MDFKEIIECKFLESSALADDISTLCLSHRGPGNSNEFPNAASASGSRATCESPV